MNVNGIKQAAAWSVIMQAALEHTASSFQKNWCIPDLISFNEQSSQGIVDRKAGMKVTGITPYWINRFTAVQNDFDLQGLFLLTAPNMSGKSTLMRSILVAALLANCGLFVPCGTAQIPRYDNFFLRTSSHDVPSEGKSAFALEMQDMQIVLLDSTHQSLIMIDELGMSPSATVVLLLQLQSAQLHCVDTVQHL
jgi:DNA mismatch repair ATPase MutS